MYSVLKDIRTGTYYMAGNKTSFYAFTDTDNFSIKEIPPADRKNVRLVTTDIDDKRELETDLYNAGFFEGFLDGKNYRLQKKNLYYWKRNPNEIAYAQHMLTGDKRYLTYIKKDKLITLAKLDNRKQDENPTGAVYFPTVRLDSGDFAVLTYTSESRFSDGFLDKYRGWCVVRMSWDAKCIVNDRFIIP